MPPKKRHSKVQRSQIEAVEIEELELRIAEGAPALGTQHSEAPAGSESYVGVRKFSELPLSRYTKDALKEAKYEHLTAIQRYALPHALCGCDVLGAAKTGSGKTLAFIIPLLEKLYRTKWSLMDGLGAIVISPTRELALQIFDELRRVGKHHDFSAGLLIGGKDVKAEQEHINGMNILICTPGRLLQHMDETPGFEASRIMVLVLDEADRILDMGFSATVNAIIENLPRERQTMLFSATQTKSVKQLARLSLVDPEYIAVHENAEAPTPAKLEQAYATVELHDKISVLWSFIRSHLKSKILVFVTTSKQVKFLFEAFRRLQPGSPLRCLHGNMKQAKRTSVFYNFAQASQGMVLLATDVAARGLDFAKLDWVVQLDCPENVAAYIHRVGRTARYISAGRSLLLLTPSEHAFLQQLEAAKVPIKTTKINPNKTQPLTPALQALLSKNQDLKESAQRALKAYLRSVFLQPNREVFDVSKLQVAEYALSLGLPSIPKLRMVKKVGKAVKEVNIRAPRLEDNGNTTEADTAGDSNSPEAEVGPSGRSPGAVPSTVTTEDPSPTAGYDDLLVLKRRDALGVGEQVLPVTALATDTKRKRKKKLKIDPTAVSGKRVAFDEEGAVEDPLARMTEDAFQSNAAGGHSTAEQRFRAAAAALKARDVADRADYRERRRAQAADAKAKRRAREANDIGEEAVVSLGPGLGYPGEERAAGGESPTDGDASGDWRMTHDDSGDEEDVWNSDDEGPEALAGGKRRIDDVRPLVVKRARVEKGHKGMAPKAGRQQSLEGLTLAEQEALALKRLANR